MAQKKDPNRENEHTKRRNDEVRTEISQLDGNTVIEKGLRSGKMLRLDGTGGGNLVGR